MQDQMDRIAVQLSADLRQVPFAILKEQHAVPINVNLQTPLPFVVPRWMIDATPLKHVQEVALNVQRILERTTEHRAEVDYNVLLVIVLLVINNAENNHLRAISTLQKLVRLRLITVVQSLASILQDQIHALSCNRISSMEQNVVMVDFVKVDNANQDHGKIRLILGTEIISESAFRSQSLSVLLSCLSCMDC